MCSSRVTKPKSQQESDSFSDSRLITSNDELRLGGAGG